MKHNKEEKLGPNTILPVLTMYNKFQKKKQNNGSTIYLVFQFHNGFLGKPIRIITSSQNVFKSICPSELPYIISSKTQYLDETYFPMNFLSENVEMSRVINNLLTC